jgi:hypothetical protein
VLIEKRSVEVEDGLIFVSLEPDPPIFTSLELTVRPASLYAPGLRDKVIESEGEVLFESVHDRVRH